MYWLAALGIAAMAGQVCAQAYPAKPVRFIVTYPPGGSSEIMARIIGQNLADAWGQSVIVEPRPGADGAIGMDYASKQAPDGYTFLLGNFGPVVAMPLLTKVPYNTKRDFIPVSRITYAANILVVPNSMPVRNVKQLVALASEKVKSRLGDLGVETISSTPEQFGAFMDQEIARWGKLIEDAKLKLN